MYGDMENWTDFTYTLMQACSHFTLDIVPVAFMIYCHHRTFSNEAEVHETVETEVSTKMMSSKDTSRFATSQRDEVVVYLSDDQESDCGREDTLTAFNDGQNQLMSNAYQNPTD